MSHCSCSLSLENDNIRRHANGGEKVVFAQRNPLTEMYPNAEIRNFEQEKISGRMPRGEPSAKPTK